MAEAGPGRTAEPVRPRRGFPEGYLWGAGTSALQHEGSPLADGAGQSIMYRWAHTPGRVPAGQDFDVSADFYRRFRDDVRLMRQIGLRAYNFSTAWSRIVPDGRGRINPRGLDFYDALVDTLLEAEIAPLCNLYVFDHPAELEDRGGWLNRDMARWFSDYASVVYERLGDRVQYWTTMCEPRFLSHVGHVVGSHPPEKTDITGGLRVLHHLLLGQGHAVQAFRAGGAKGRIGGQHLLIPVAAASDDERDIAAAERVDAYLNLSALDPQWRGAYPQVLIDWYGAAWPADGVGDHDLETIAAPVDFLGVDYYLSLTVRHSVSDPTGLFNAGLQMAPVAGRTDADGLRTALNWARDHYRNPPILLLEVGQAGHDTVNGDEVDDVARQLHLHDMLAGTHQAIQDGVDVRGSFVWSLLDGWEFGKGLSERYGLVHVDYRTQRRTVKRSGRWYRRTIARNGWG
ncbi:glycoside hydrolase family 1 protein [Marinactinospora thermotolerans]|uniref:Beta-glucosidase n=1 Tax=Marinactinospora thermotolerans DSM 45154 TaxID=1122192 RepID=A0A1T4PKY0_9ACTN|nr:family 1 glycosylhydrolase [Marinactinospora thermotolerans]SJZ92233.1 beta-glucosidase [Marinactinospora thermotolerans DSM 45154]